MARYVIGSLEAGEDYQWAHDGQPFDEQQAVAQLRGYLRALGAGGDGERFTVGRHLNNGHIADDGSPALNARLLSRLEVLSALSRLRHDERRAVELHLLAGWPIQDVARQLDCTKRTVYNLINHGLARTARMVYDGVTFTELPPDPVVDDDTMVTPAPAGYQDRARCKGCGAFSGHSWEAGALVDGYCPSCTRMNGRRHNGHQQHADLDHTRLLYEREQE